MQTIKRYNTYFIIICLAVAGLTAGCRKSFITDVNSPSRIPVNEYYKTQADFNAALTGIYGTLRSIYDKFWIMSEVTSDNVMVPLGNAANTKNFDWFTYNSTESQVQSTYLGYYTTIAHCNNFLLRIGSFNMDTVLKSRWIGEAKFIRAMMYFDLVRFYGNIPMPLVPITTDSMAYTFPQVGATAVYTQIISDLQAAETLVPANYAATGAAASGAVYTTNDIGRVTSGAVKALLGKVYLTTGDYTKATAKLEELIPGAPGATATTPLFGYSLLTKYSDVFSQANKNNAEIIFNIQYTSGPFSEGSNFTYYFYPNVKPSLLSYIQPQALGLLTPDLFKAFEPNDSRTATSCSNQGATAGTTIGNYYSLKYQDNPLATYQGNCNWIVLRYADVLLMEAEALANNDDYTNALVYLNRVRTRARNGQAATVVPARVFSTKAQLLADILKERRVELSMEGQRWFDLLRSGATNFVNTLQAELKADGFSVNAANVTATKMLFPIPFRELNLNAAYVPNPGY
ncbi:MAG: RagB/SusD family nutrient uptake outer membrane protein [Filimonas sp.]|nr:RagB/SusD family nutrient uptake outer membrane protein [Filimonas sp.]